jgi:hypothetical protein
MAELSVGFALSDAKTSDLRILVLIDRSINILIEKNRVQ